MTKQEYLYSCYSQLFAVFELAKELKKDDKQKFRTEGFIHAGRALGVISEEEAIKVMEQAHFDVFGETIDDRRKRKASIKEAVAKGDDDFINIPAYERLKP